MTDALGHKLTKHNRQKGNHDNHRSRDENADLPHTNLLIMVFTSAEQARLRQTIRDTWMKLSAQGSDTWRHYFPIGTLRLDTAARERLQLEQATHADLLLLPDHEESYASLSRKTLKTLVKSVTIARYQFLLKVDADSFVRVGQLLKALKDIQHPRLYWGFFDGRAPVHRQGKWMEREWKLCDRYLPYALGGGYVLAYDLVRFVANNARYFKM